MNKKPKVFLILLISIALITTTIFILLKLCNISISFYGLGLRTWNLYSPKLVQLNDNSIVLVDNIDFSTALNKKDNILYVIERNANEQYTEDTSTRVLAEDKPRLVSEDGNTIYSISGVTGTKNVKIYKTVDNKKELIQTIYFPISKASW